MAPNRGCPGRARRCRRRTCVEVGVGRWECQVQGGALREGRRLNAGHPSSNESDGPIRSYGRGCAFWPSFELLPDDDGAGALHPDDDDAGALGGGA